MTRKEALRMDNLIAENIRLKDEINKHFRVYGDLLADKVCIEARLETIQEVLKWPLGLEYDKPD